jgi:lysophospholipase L1-like esterase
MAALPVQAQRVSEPYDMLVLGDSITWGQGLKVKNKAWYQVKSWIEKTTGGPVLERVEAHSGAVIDGGPPRNIKTPQNGDVNFGFPSVYEQVDNALRFYSDGSRVDLVLISGCANDVGTENFLNAESSEQLHRTTEQKCKQLMEQLLHKVTGAFPVAQVVVVGYYPFFSERTPKDFVTRALARSLYQTSSENIFRRLAANSREWYRASDTAIAEAVQKVNADLGNERIAFARIEFQPEYSFAAKETRLWELDRSPFRMMLMFLTLGKLRLPTNDETRGPRARSCQDFYPAVPGETPTQKHERKNKQRLCRYAALGHPNRKGATLYANAIVEILKRTFPAR